MTRRQELGALYLGGLLFSFVLMTVGCGDGAEGQGGSDGSTSSSSGDNDTSHPGTTTGDDATTGTTTGDVTGGVVVSGELAFSSDREGNGEVYVANANGADWQNLSNHPAWDGHAKWAPTGGALVFVSERDGNREIYSVEADGANLRRLTDAPGDDTSPSWSPDGSRIVFMSEREGNGEIFVMNRDGSGQINISTHAEDDIAPRWSPIADRIVFASYRNMSPDGGYYSQLFRMASDGAEVIQLSDLSDKGSGRWSPLGDLFAFTQYDEGGHREIYLVDGDGGGFILTQLTQLETRVSSLDWSPDGVWIAFADHGDDFGDHDVFRIRGDGTALERLTFEGVAAQGIHWAPSGDLIGFSRSYYHCSKPLCSPDTSYQNDIVILDIASGDELVWRFEDSDEGGIAWRPVP